jgi:glutamate-1-semialdehyde 2,1-aminomutase
MQQLSPLGKVYQAGTFSGNPVSVSTGLAVLQTLREKQNTIYPNLERGCVQLTNALADLASAYQLDVQMNSIASMFQIFFTSSKVTDYVSAKSSDTQKFSIYFRELLKQGVFIPPSQFETCFVSTAHTREDLEQTIESFGNALHKVSTEGGTNR